MRLNSVLPTMFVGLTLLASCDDPGTRLSHAPDYDEEGSDTDPDTPVDTPSNPSQNDPEETLDPDTPPNLGGGSMLTTCWDAIADNSICVLDIETGDHHTVCTDLLDLTRNNLGVALKDRISHYVEDEETLATLDSGNLDTAIDIYGELLSEQGATIRVSNGYSNVIDISLGDRRDDFEDSLSFWSSTAPDVRCITTQDRIEIRIPKFGPYDNLPDGIQPSNMTFNEVYLAWKDLSAEDGSVQNVTFAYLPATDYCDNGDYDMPFFYPEGTTCLPNQERISLTYNYTGDGDVLAQNEIDGEGYLPQTTEMVIDNIHEDTEFITNAILAGEEEGLVYYEGSFFQ